MKRLIFIIFCLIITGVAYSQNLIFQYQNLNNGSVVNFPTNSITSDFGTRNYPGSVWHKGVDFGAQIGVALRSIEAGTVEKIKGTGFKYITIAGTNNFSYGHIFESNDGPIVSLGNFALITKQVNNLPRYAIINTATSVAIGNNLNDIVSYNEVDYVVQSNITQNQGIAPLGTSSDGNPFPPHVHLYRLKNAATDIVDNNYLNPLQVVNHTAPNYTISFETTNNRLYRLTPSTSSIFYVGNESSSACVKVQMNSPGRQGSTPNVVYSGATMNVEKVELLIKKDFELDQSYSLINGVTYQSRIEYGGMRNANGTFTNTYPLNLTGNNQAFGSSTITGVDPHAYNDDDYDLFYFSDIYTRIKNDHVVGTTPGTFADCIMEARYPDGNYNLYARMTTILNNQVSNITTPLAIKIDNFRPYIEKVEIRKTQSTGNPVYTGSWTWSSNALNFAKSVAGTITANTPLFIKVYTSEPMQNVALSAFGMATPTNSTTPVDATRKVWEFSIPAASVTAGLKTITVKSTSLDLAGNGIEGFTATSPLSGSSIPKHQNGGTWLPAANPRDDVVHTVDVAAPPVADFTGNPVTPKVGSSVNFTDASTNNPTSWSWTFQGGTPSTSTSQNPVVKYNTAGTYNVSLTVTNAAGSTSTKNKPAYITVTPLAPPVCDFTMSATQITRGQSVTCTDASTNNPTSWSWSFPGGTPGTGSLRSHVVTYSTAGTYSVSLQVTNADGSDVATKSIIVVEPQYIISGTVYVDVTPHSGVTVSFNPGGTTQTGADGKYSYSVQNNWSGTIRATKTGYTFIEVAVSPVTSDRTIDLHGFPVPKFRINYSPLNPVSGQIVTFWLTPNISANFEGIWDWGDNSATESDHGVITEMTHPFGCDLELDESYTVNCTIYPRDGTDPFTLQPVTIFIPKCTQITAAAEYTNGCSTVKLGQPVYLTDISYPFETMMNLNIKWNATSSAVEQYFTPLSPYYANYTHYPTSRQFSYVYSTKGHKSVKWHACAQGFNDYKYIGFNIVDCSSTVYSNKLSNCTYDNWEGVNRYWAGTIIFAGSAGNYVADPNKKLEFSACNGIELKPGFSANPTGDSYLLLVANDPCLSLVSPKGTIEPYNSENNVKPIISNEKALNADLNLKVFPNPTSHTINLEYSGDVSKILSIEIICSTGELMLKQTSGFSNPLQLNVEHFAPGVYCVRLVTSSKSVSKVFIKD